MQLAPLQPLAIARGTVYAQPLGPHFHAIPEDESLPALDGAATTQAPVTLT
jgi:hypothetical protein